MIVLTNRIYKFGIVSLSLIFVLYIIAIMGRHTFNALLIVSLTLIFPLIIIALTAFFIGYMSKGKIGEAIGLGVIFAIFSYIITIALATPFGESKFVSRMKQFSSTNHGMVANLTNNVKGNIYLNVIWIFLAVILFAIIGFALRKKYK